MIKDNTNKERSPILMGKKIFKEGGVRLLYKGLTATVLRDIP
jgi:hypothetical protein